MPLSAARGDADDLLLFARKLVSGGARNFVFLDVADADRIAGPIWPSVARGSRTRATRSLDKSHSLDRVRQVSDMRSCQVRRSSSTVAHRKPSRIDARLDIEAKARRR